MRFLRMNGMPESLPCGMLAISSRSRMHSLTSHRIFSATAALLLAAATLAAIEPAKPPHGDGGGWTQVSQSEQLTVFNRPRKDSSIQEVKAVGVIEAKPIVVKRVLDDTDEYPRFMPYVIEARVISRSRDMLVGYQRLSPPLVSDRDYTMRVRTETRQTADGTCYCKRWEAANELGPVEIKGVARVKVNEGYWLLEPANGGQYTRATYCLFSDSGGSLPAAILNAANRTAIPKLFDCVRKQAKIEKYSREE